MSSTEQLDVGALFFALRGTRVDGHELIREALEKNAVAVVIEEEKYFSPSKPSILVDNTREALALTASRWHDEPSKKLSVVGITGTNGKTTTTYLLRKIWNHLRLKSGIVGTVEYHIGDKTEPSRLTTPDPLTLQALFARMVTEQIKVAAIEVSSIALDQHRVTGTAFEVAAFTNLTQDHLDYHGDFERYYEAKRKLFVDLAPRNAVINIDDPAGARLLNETVAKTKLSLSLSNPAADFSVLDAQFSSGGTRATLKTPAGNLMLETPLIGKHNLYNCLTALASVHALGQSLPDAVAALRDAMGAPGRLERVAPAPDRPHVFVDYAHTDDALANVLRALIDIRGQDKVRIITIFGCGGDRDKTKRPKMAAVASSMSDVTIATSDNPRTEDPESILDGIETGIRRDTTEYHREVSRRKAIHLALSLAQAGDLVLIAGKGHEDYQIVGTEKLPFDDRQVVREYYLSSLRGGR